MCVWYLCVQRGSKYLKAVSDWLTSVSELYGTILVGGLSPALSYVPSQIHDCSALQCDSFYFQT